MTTEYVPPFVERLIGRPIVGGDGIPRSTPYEAVLGYLREHGPSTIKQMESVAVLAGANKTAARRTVEAARIAGVVVLVGIAPSARGAGAYIFDLVENADK